MRSKLLLLLFLSVFTLQSCCYNCSDDINAKYISSYEPVIFTRGELEASLQIRIPQPIAEAGKIYVFDDYLFVNEKRKGYHVFDNADPAAPRKMAFINLPGSTDLSIRDGVLYANQARDLIAFKINFATLGVEVTKRIPNTFPILYAPDGYYPNVNEDEIVVDYELKND